MNSIKKPIYAKKKKNGKIGIINGTSCSEGYCKEYGCDFPNCATLSNEEFNSIKEAKLSYPNLEII